MERRATKIPRPPPVVLAGPLQPLTDNEVNGRKRKGMTSPLPKDAEHKKRPAPSSDPCLAESGTLWEDYAAEGDSAEDCLNFKLTIKKKDSAATIKEVTLSYIKKLRALGWHLHLQCERLGMDYSGLQSAYDAEVQGRAEEKTASLSKAAVLHTQVEALQGDLAKEQEACRQKEALSQSVTRELESAQKSESDARQTIQQLEEGAARALEQITDLQKQVASANELHQSSTRYCAQLQEYNSKLQTDAQATSEQLRALQEEKSKNSEDIAMLRGTLGALETQLAAVRAACTAAEAASQRATAETLSLQSELEKVRTERSGLADALEAVQKELKGYKDDVGQGPESERAKAAALQSRTRAQAEVNSSLAEQLAFARESLAVAEQLVAARGAECRELKRRAAEAEAARTAAEQRVAECEATRRKLHNTILTLKGNIRVFCRVRPLAPCSPDVEKLETGQPVLAFPPVGDAMTAGVELTASNGNKNTFTFDHVFGPTASQEDVFEEVSLLVQSALDGYKVCIFAYGQTGSGKTHTMLGTPDQAGLIPRAVEQLFTAARELEVSQGWTFEMKASMLEIYNEEYKDLLGKGPPSGKKHTVTHDERAGTTAVSYLEGVECADPEAVRTLLERAARLRAVGATAANERSSRSHMVFLLSIRGANAATGQRLNGMLNLIDLAGSERLKTSGANGERLKETQAINKSLSALGDVIAALGSREAHIPYRNSKLTWLLQGCLGGDAKMLMIANVAPTLSAANESLCSLRFAAKVNATEIGTARRSTSFAK